MKALKAINDIVADKLTVTEQGALARLLEACQEEEGTEESCSIAYTGAVDFLWMAFRISDGEKEKLQELVYGEGWWKP